MFAAPELGLSLKVAHKIAGTHHRDSVQYHDLLRTVMINEQECISQLKNYHITHSFTYQKNDLVSFMIKYGYARNPKRTLQSGNKWVGTVAKVCERAPHL